MTEKREFPEFNTGGRTSIVIALASLAMAVMELRKAAELSTESKKFIGDQLDDVLFHLARLNGERPEKQKDGEK